MNDAEQIDRILKTVRTTVRRYMENEKKRGKKPNSAIAELDQRLAEAVRERGEAYRQVSELLMWQTRLQRVEQEINSLIEMKHRLNGGTAPAVVPSPASFQAFGELPSGVGSIPTRQPQPANPVAAALGEGGFE
jgi:hypothetical protein